MITQYLHNGLQWKQYILKITIFLHTHCFGQNFSPSDIVSIVLNIVYRYRIFLRKSRIFLRLYRIFLRFEFTTGFFSGCTGFFSGIAVECTRLFSTVLWSVRKYCP